jgi:hypothetical protein
VSLIISAHVSNEGRDTWLEGVGMGPLLDRTGERVGFRSHVERVDWKRTRPDIMIKIPFPNFKKVGIVDGRDDLADDVCQSTICGDVMYKIAKDSNVNRPPPDVLALFDVLLESSFHS